MDKIRFILDNIPDAYNKDSNSNIYKLLQPISKELDDFLLKLDEVKKSRLIDYAQGGDLDKIAKLLKMKRFNNETDESFRGRIKSRVPSFVGGGAISAIKQVVNNYLGVEPIIIEHYKPGEGHALFDKGVLKGLETEKIDASNLKVKKGTAYINGNRFSLNESTIPNVNGYLKYNLIPSGTKRVATFQGKVSASTVENPHIFKGRTGTLGNPTLSGDWIEQSQTQIDRIKLLGDTPITSISTSTNTNISQQLFSFDLIQEIERNLGRIPKVTLAEKVQWVKDNVEKLQVDWHGFGSSVGGNRANISLWVDSGSVWGGSSTHTNSTVTSLTKVIPTSYDFSLHVTSNGFIHALAYANASDGTTASTINTDYVKLEITLKENAYITNESDNVLRSNQILLSQISASNPIDGRFLLNPEEHYITNTASITVQIPYAFDTSKISLNDTKDVLRSVKAAGVALLINVMETFNETITIKDNVSTVFLMGYSGMGGNNTMGG